MYLACAEEMRQMDRTTIESFGIPGRVLMENAGRGATGWLLETLPDTLERRIAVIAGRGNNGGDGFVMARYLAQRGAEVTVFLLAEESKVSGDAKANLDLLSALNVPVICIPDEKSFARKKTTLSHRHLFIDALLGTGLKFEVKGLFAKAIDFMNRSGRPVFAVDMPSGLDSDTGQPRGACVKATATATFGFAKPGQVLFPGAAFTGKLGVVDIGIPPFVADEADSRRWLLTPAIAAGYLRPRMPDAHKGSAGHLLAVAGSAGKTGAAAMVGIAAMRSGAGLVTLAVPAGINAIVESLATEVMTLPVGNTGCRMFDETCMDSILEQTTGKKALAIGPGMGTGPAAESMLRGLIEKTGLPMVIDADGLTCLADDPGMLSFVRNRAVLTPHPGEMGRLCGTTADQVQNDRIRCARDFARTHQIHLVLKGAGTVIAHPDGTVFVNRTGNPGMASGGMGDVLTGVIAGLVCQGYDIGIAARLGVFLHGLAGDIAAESGGKTGLLASDVSSTLPRALQTLESKDHDRFVDCFPAQIRLA
ncbi:MAG: NAD(P)H-hydrate dehydratase [Thermodesulfobacteriota bacterium]|nr:NAD(P)H-hydrate dehydratase [Thermodesulfobacteriota bacterium]